LIGNDWRGDLEALMLTALSAEQAREIRPSVEVSLTALTQSDG